MMRSWTIGLGAAAWMAAAAAVVTAEGPAAPINPYHGMQTRVETFEFAESPKVAREGDRWVVTFAAKAACDATVAVVDKDGRVVRHLASGVLGANAPWPFQQGSLSQRIEWDGKDDAGKPAPAGCKVKVGLGLRFTYDWSIGDDSSLSDVQSLVVGQDGSLYVAGHSMVKVFDREGRYQKTLMPIRGGPDISGAFPTVTTADGDAVPAPIGGSMYAFAAMRSTTPKRLGRGALTPGDRQLLLYWYVAGGGSGRAAQSLVKLDAKTGALPPGSLVNLGHNYVCRPIGLGGPGSKDPHEVVSLALSPDGETLYVSGLYDVVFRGRLRDLTAPGSIARALRGNEEDLTADRLPEVFLGERDRPGKDEKHFDGTRGIAVDADGNVYVADHGNDRVQVFAPDGKFLRSLPAEKPEQIALNKRTGAVYCVRTVKTGRARLTRLAGPDASSPPVSFELTYVMGRGLRVAPNPAVAVDSGAEPPWVWFGVGDRVVRLADKGASFEQTGVIPRGDGAALDTSALGQCRIVVDRETETVYLSTGKRLSRPPWYRIDGRTGKLDESFETPTWEDMAIGSDGTILCRTPGYGHFVVRFDRDFKPRPFKHGVVGHREMPEGWPADGAALYTGARGTSCIYNYGIAVDPTNGDIYVRSAPQNAEWCAKVIPDGKSLPPDELAKLASWAPGGVRCREEAVLVWDRDGNPKTAQAIVDAKRIHGNGIRIGRTGDLYLSVADTGSQRFGPPDGLAANVRLPRSVGSVWKFRNNGTGAFGSVANLQKDGDDVPGLLWGYRGQMPVRIGCGCDHSRIGLDGFDRLYVPAMHLYSIVVLDANGNRIARVGRRGNTDSRGKGSLVPDPEIGIGWIRAVEASDEAMYIGDEGNQRFVRAAMSYVAEQTLPLP